MGKTLGKNNFIYVYKICTFPKTISFMSIKYIHPQKCNKYHLFFKKAVSWKWGLWKIRTMTELAMCSCSSNEKLQHARHQDSGGSGAIVQLNREQEPKVEHATPQPLKQMPEQPTVPKYSSSCPAFRVPQVHNVQRKLSWIMLQITIYLLLNIKFKSKTNSVEGWITECQYS